MSRGVALVGSVAFLMLGPGTVAGLVPWWISRWDMQRPLLGVVAFRMVGAALVALGAAALLDSFARFAVRGLGTPAPVLPPRNLVVTGLYRHVRNPMYVAVVSVILGQALLLGDVQVLGYGLLVWFACHLFVIGYEADAPEELRRGVRSVPRERAAVDPAGAGLERGIASTLSPSPA